MIKKYHKDERFTRWAMTLTNWLKSTAPPIDLGSPGAWKQLTILSERWSCRAGSSLSSTMLRAFLVRNRYGTTITDKITAFVGKALGESGQLCDEHNNIKANMFYK